MRTSHMNMPTHKHHSQNNMQICLPNRQHRVWSCLFARTVCSIGPQGPAKSLAFGALKWTSSHPHYPQRMWLARPALQDACISISVCNARWSCPQRDQTLWWSCQHLYKPARWICPLLYKTTGNKLPVSISACTLHVCSPIPNTSMTFSTSTPAC